MRNRSTPLLAALVCAGTSLGAQNEATAPLSVIDWLDTQGAIDAAVPKPDEPDVAASGTVPQVTVQPLRTDAAQRVGLAPSNVTGLPDTLWQSTDAASLSRAVNALPDAPLPALQDLILTLLLAEANPPQGEAQRFDLARVDALTTFGALDPAIALLEQTPLDKRAAKLARYMDLSLMSGDVSTACTLILANPKLSPGEAYDVFCNARAGNWEDAVLVLGTARVLGLISEDRAAALERFLDPELFEGDPPLTVPSTPDPLTFRLFEAIGTPIPTRVWPLVYANADLSPNAGWKAQLEAAERLAQRGALGDNRLLGLYTQRQPAASGGVWDRAAAVQRFETALSTGSEAAVLKTLPAAWRAMGQIGLQTVFAKLFAEDVGKLVLSGPAADLAFEVLLLSPAYEMAARQFPSRALQRPVAVAVATGDVPADLTADGVRGAILAAFRDAPPDAGIVEAAQAGDLGLALLNAIALTHGGTGGDVARLTTGLATLRALGLEDVARRTALQVLLLGNAG
ncbi:hypothetical protein [Tateyamaria sp. ANG-S1]|uniref:hypothetical protein n=1 Tax=Tateyamaria sp. ANG-S1 TaxID=1577905 RepID=UPI00057F0F36|nr:hypothetical protein [Tateyamaria sp. ANG-S1]KIC48980.1 hypothetical protein RA29_15115 [Tateyamaria sp. ANG-S1]